MKTKAHRYTQEECHVMPRMPRIVGITRSSERGMKQSLPQSSEKESTLLTTGFHTSSLQDCERRNSCCLWEFAPAALGNKYIKQEVQDSNEVLDSTYVPSCSQNTSQLSTFQKSQLTNSHQNELSDIQYLQSRRERGKCRRGKAAGSMLPPL